MGNLNELIRRINPKNGAIRRAKELLEFVAKGPHGQRETYAAGIYLFIGDDANHAVEAITYGLEENLKSYGFGLCEEMPPSEKSLETLRAINNNINVIPKVLCNSYKKSADFFETFDVMTRDNEKLREEVGTHILRLAIMEGFYKSQVKYNEAERIAGFLVQMPNVIRNGVKLVKEQ